MRNFIFALTSVFLVNCANKTTYDYNSMIGMEFVDIDQIDKFSNYFKVSDTVIDEADTEAKYGILHLRDTINNLILFNRISYDGLLNRIYKILDTLILPKRNKNEFVTIGYCSVKNSLDESFIAIVDKTDSLQIQNIKKAWSVNTDSEKIEYFKNLNKMTCFNEWFCNE
ncbi:hypothetical protein ACFFU9_02750 [Mariniflexile ostreae]|uniref:Lipoprotein n=1 Tax=Mariniflexile ostreae TaxID=1520892 RepID=A0ABV5F8F2_9FLAO